MKMTWRQSFAKRSLLHALNQVRDGQLTLLTNDGEYRFGDPAGELQALIQIHHERFWERILFDGDEGAGDSYVDGDWSTPDLVSVVRLVVRNTQISTQSRWGSLLSRLANKIRHMSHRNTVEGSRRNISAHYDLSNDLFQTFLDRHMVYSCGYFPTADASLELAQMEKIDRLCRKLRLQPGDHLLEIGTGWGALALHAAERYGCRVTTTTISREQYDHAAGRFAESPCADRIQLLQQDYRTLTGKFHKIASVEMFEAVGLDFYDDFFRTCDRLLTDDGVMAMQTITMNEHRFAEYRRTTDWIQRRVFPGGELASIREIQASLVRATKLSLFHMEEIGMHYAHTLAEWNRRFQHNLGRIREMGFDDRFIRTWEYYLAYCEGAFRERYIGTAQLVLTKASASLPHYAEPWKLGVEAQHRNPAY